MTVVQDFDFSATPVVGAVLAVRTFRLGDDGALLPTTQPAGKPWTVGENTATCTYHDHAAPYPGCSCGFYAYNHPGYVNGGELHGRSGPVLAVVELYGRVEAGEYGYTAEKARIVAVVIPWRVGPLPRKAFHARYPGVSTYTTRRRMLAEHPLTDPTTLGVTEAHPPTRADLLPYRAAATAAWLGPALLTVTAILTGAFAFNISNGLVLFLFSAVAGLAIPMQVANRDWFTRWGNPRALVLSSLVAWTLVSPALIGWLYGMPALLPTGIILFFWTVWVYDFADAIYPVLRRTRSLRRLIGDGPYQPAGPMYAQLGWLLQVFRDPKGNLILLAQTAGGIGRNAAWSIGMSRMGGSSVDAVWTYKEAPPVQGVLIVGDDKAVVGWRRTSRPQQQVTTRSWTLASLGIPEQEALPLFAGIEQGWVPQSTRARIRTELIPRVMDVAAVGVGEPPPVTATELDRHVWGRSRGETFPVSEPLTPAGKATVRHAEAVAARHAAQQAVQDASRVGVRPAFTLPVPRIPNVDEDTLRRGWEELFRQPPFTGTALWNTVRDSLPNEVGWTVEVGTGRVPDGFIIDEGTESFMVEYADPELDAAMDTEDRAGSFGAVTTGHRVLSELVTEEHAYAQRWCAHHSRPDPAGTWTVVWHDPDWFPPAPDAVTPDADTETSPTEEPAAAAGEPPVVYATGRFLPPAPTQPDTPPGDPSR